jgi:hypothetical protein
MQSFVLSPWVDLHVEALAVSALVLKSAMEF